MRHRDNARNDTTQLQFCQILNCLHISRGFLSPALNSQKLTRGRFQAPQGMIQPRPITTRMFFNPFPSVLIPSHHHKEGSDRFHKVPMPCRLIPGSISSKEGSHLYTEARYEQIPIERSCCKATRPNKNFLMNNEQQGTIKEFKVKRTSFLFSKTEGRERGWMKRELLSIKHIV